MSLENYVGYAAAILTTVAYVPQTIKVYKTRHTKDISLGMFSTISLGILGWLIYGILLNSFPIIIANALTLIMATYIFAMKIKLDYIDVKKKEKKN